MEQGQLTEAHQDAIAQVDKSGVDMFWIIPFVIERVYKFGLRSKLNMGRLARTSMCAKLDDEQIVRERLWYNWGRIHRSIIDAKRRERL